MNEEPPLISDSARPPNAGTVATVLVIAGLVDLVWSISTFSLALGAAWHVPIKFNVSFVFSFIGWWIAAFFVERGGRAAWLMLYYSAAAGLAMAIVFAIAIGFVLPARLLAALWHVHTGWVAFHLLYSLWMVGLLGWLLREAKRGCAAASFALPGNSWLRPQAAAIAMSAFCLLPIFSVHLLLRSMQGDESRATVAARLGPAYDYRVISIHVKTVNGQTTRRSVVLAFNERELRVEKVER